MAGIWNEVGYSARGRLPLTNRLFAGQFQTGKVNVFMRPGNYTNINIVNGGCDMYPPPPPPEDNHSSGLMGWITGLSIFGGIFSAAGSIISAWGGSHGKDKVEGQGSTKETEVSAEDKLKKDLATYNEAYKDNCKILGPQSDGSFIIIDKTGKHPKRTEVKDFDALKAELQRYDGEETKSVDPVKPPEVEQPEVPPSVEAPKAKTQAEVLSDLQKIFPGLTQELLDGLDGVEFKDGKYFKDGKELTPDDIYEALTGNKPIASNFDLSKIDNKLIGVYDDGKNANGKEIGDFKNAQLVKYDSNTKTATIGNHKYKVVNQDDRYLYLEDTNPKGGTTNNRQVYTLEINKQGIYQLHQRNFMGEFNIGTGRAAHSS